MNLEKGLLHVSYLCEEFGVMPESTPLFRRLT